MRNLLMILLLSVFSFAIEQKFLDPQDAFKQSFTQEKDKTIINLELGKNIYLYDEKVKVFITKPFKKELTKHINIPAPVVYKEFIVHFDDLKLEIPNELLQKAGKASSYELEFQFQGCSTAGLCYAPMSEITTISFDKVVSPKMQNKINLTKEDLSESDLITNTLKNGNIVIVLLTFFGFGLLLSLTPCIFPMIPILSSIIVKAGSKEKLTAKKGFFLSFVYVFSMSLAYTLAGIIAGLFGANLQVALQNPYVLSVFSAVFVLLAFSMFGYFKLELPQSLQNKINKTTDGKEKQGVFGIAIMGFLSALIVGPCVAAPLAGALIYIGQTGDAVLGGAALFILSFGMGVPLLLIGLGAGKYMPKPGAWMDSISKIFGLVMLGIAIFMLDRIVDVTLSMFLYSFLLLGSAIYLKMYEHVLVRLFTLLMFVYGVSLFIGALSGSKNVLNPLEVFTSKTSLSSSSKLIFTKVRNIKELNEAIKASKKPVMLDFYADWCISCIELEEITFEDEKVRAKLKNFTLLKADVTKNTQDDKDLQKKYGIFGPPGLIFFNTNNQEVKAAKIIGYKNPEDFLNIINKYF